jgi:hypothetical protein
MAGVLFVNTTDQDLVEVSSSNPLPVSIANASSTTPLNVAIANATESAPLPVALSGSAGTLDVQMPGITAGNPLPVSFPGTGMNVTVADFTSSTPMQVEFAGGGGTLPVSLDTLISGEDQAKGWLKVADGATQMYHSEPTPTATGGDMPTELALGAAGAAGDYLKTLIVSVSSATNAAVYLVQDGQASLTSGGSGTALAAAGTSVTLTATAAFTATQNAHKGRILTLTYTPTGGAAPIKFRRRVTAHAAFTAATTLTFTVSHNLPAGGTIGTWTLEGTGSFELVPYNTPVGLTRLELGMVSTYGGWKINSDSGVSVTAIGKFS